MGYGTRCSSCGSTFDGCTCGSSSEENGSRASDSDTINVHPIIVIIVLLVTIFCMIYFAVK
jgi:hypothetical protein